MSECFRNVTCPFRVEKLLIMKYCVSMVHLHFFLKTFNFTLIVDFITKVLNFLRPSIWSMNLFVQVFRLHIFARHSSSIANTAQMEAAQQLALKDKVKSHPQMYRVLSLACEVSFHCMMIACLFQGKGTIERQVASCGTSLSRVWLMGKALCQQSATLDLWTSRNINESQILHRHTN